MPSGGAPPDARLTPPGGLVYQYPLQGASREAQERTGG